MAVRNPKPIPDSEKLEMARNYKAEGNEFHKSKDYRRAIGKYHRALLQLKAIGQSKSSGISALMSEEHMNELGYSTEVSPEMQSEVFKLMSDCYNNLAACILQQENPNYDKVVEYCEKVLELAPQNIKGYYRRGLAYLNLKKYEMAVESFNQAAAIAKDTEDKNFKTLLAKQLKLCQDGLRQQEQQLKEAYHGMFNKKTDNR